MTVEKSNEGIIVRNGAKKDVAEVVALWKNFMAYHAELSCAFSERPGLYSIRPGAHKQCAEYFIKAIQNPDWCALVAECDGVIAGYTICQLALRPPVLREKKFGFISDMMVAEKFRGRGVGRALLEAALAWFRKKRMKTIELNVLRGNDMGEGFWSHMGFEPVMSRKMLNL